jgi:hypothetical protein
MRIPRVRFTVRGMLCLVAVAGAALAGGRYFGEKSGPLSRGYRAPANEHAIRVYQLGTWPVENTPEKRPLTRRRVAYHAALEAKYSYAVDHPWLPMAPDPPEPE